MSGIPDVSEAVLAQLGSEMPRCEPFTYTHGELDPSNFIIANGEVVGMLDWEWSGFYPVWWEYVRFRWYCETQPAVFPNDWYQLLLEGMDVYPEAFDWYRKVRNLWYLGLEEASTMYRERGLNTVEELKRKAGRR